MNKPIRQHWVPRVYLRRFATPESVNTKNPKIIVFDLNTDKEFRTSIDKILVQNHLYTLGTDSDKPSYIVEETLAKIEGWSKPCIEAFSKGQAVHVKPQSKYLAAIFFATLLMRNPHMIEVQENSFRALKDICKSSNHIIDTEEDLAFVKDGEDDTALRVLSNWYSQLEEQGRKAVFAGSIINTAKSLATDLVKKKWSLLRAVEGEFITSDNPVTVFHPRTFPYGICTDDVHIHIAITPKILLVLGGEISWDENRVYNIPAKIVETMNCLTITKAQRFLISSFSFNGLQNLIQEAKLEV